MTNYPQGLQGPQNGAQPARPAACYRIVRRSTGRTFATLECPWCHDVFNAPIWSLSGSGKRCPTCRAKHTMRSTRDQPVAAQPPN